MDGLGGSGSVEAIMTQRLFGHYRLIERLSKGAAGEVHLAWDTKLNRRIRLCLVSGVPTASDDAGRIFHEVTLELSRCRHPGLLAPVGLASLTSDQAWFAIEHVDAIPLRGLIRRLDRVPWRETAMILHEAAAVLAFVHTRKLFHDAVNAESVVVERHGRVHLGPFEVVRRVLVAAGQPEGDPMAYREEPLTAAPELHDGQAPSARSDVFALGAVAWEMLSGRRPFADADALRAHGEADDPEFPRLPPDVDETLAGLVTRMLSPRPADRPEDGAEIRDALRQLLRGAGVADVRGALRRELERRKEILSLSTATAEGAPQRTVTRALRTRGARPEAPAGTAKAPRRRKTDERREAGPAAPPTRGRGSSLMDDAATLLADMEGQAQKGSAPASSGRTWAWIGAVGLLLVLLAALGIWWGSDDQTIRKVPAQEPALPTASAPLPPPVVREAPRAQVQEDGIDLAQKQVDALLTASNYETAETLARDALIRTQEGDSGLSIRLGKALMGQARVDDAVRSFVQADADSEGVEGHLLAAEALARDGRCGEAMVVFDQAASRAPSHSGLLKHRGNCEVILGRYKAAIRTLEQARAQSPTDLDVLVPLGIAYEKRGKMDRALAVYQLAQRVDPDSRAAELGRLRAQAAGGRAKDLAPRLAAEVATPEALADDDSVALETKGHAAFKAGSYTVAVQFFDEAMRRLPRRERPSARLVRNLALALDRAGQDSRAAKAYEMALGKTPRDVELHRLLASLHQRRGRMSAAIRVLEQAASRVPDDAGVAFELGILLLGEKRHEKAVKVFQRVTRLRPRDVAAHKNLVLAQLELGQDQAALGTLRRWAGVGLQDPEPWLHMAAIQQKAGQGVEMKTSLREACRRGASQACQ